MDDNEIDMLEKLNITDKKIIEVVTKSINNYNKTNRLIEESIVDIKEIFKDLMEIESYIKK